MSDVRKYRVEVKEEDGFIIGSWWVGADAAEGRDAAALAAIERVHARLFGPEPQEEVIER